MSTGALDGRQYGCGLYFRYNDKVVPDKCADVCAALAWMVLPGKAIEGAYRLRARVVVFAIVGLLCAGVAAATQTWFGSTVSRVYPQADGSFVVTFTSDVGSTCTSASSPKYYNVAAGQSGVTADAVKAMLAIVITAYSMGSSVAINFDDATSNCYVNRLYY